MMGVQCKVEPPDEVYYQGWGQACSKPLIVKCTWELATTDSESKPVTIRFDLTEGVSPLILGIDFLQFADTCNTRSPRVIRFKRPGDDSIRTMFTYIAADHDGNQRLRLEIVPHAKSYRTLLASHLQHDARTIATKIHAFSHAHADDIKAILKDVGRLDADAARACDEVTESCGICASTGRPAQHRKVSLTHVNSAFNGELQADFTVVFINGGKYEVLNLNDAGTRYGERTIATTRSAEAIKTIFEQAWLYQHGAPTRFSSDPEFCRPVLRRFLEGHGVTVLPRPSRSSHKNGRVERNNGVFKLIVERVARADANASPATIVARASFLTNCIRGSKLLSAFQVVRGYRPAVSGIPAKAVSQDMIDAYIAHEATRALNRMINARMPVELSSHVLPPGTAILVYYKSSKQCERNGWIQATVVGTTEHSVICRRHEKGQPMNVAYGDVRLLPDNEISRRLATVDAEDDVDEGDYEDATDSAPETVGALMTTAVRNPTKDIGMDIDDRNPAPIGDLTTDEDKVLTDIKRIIGSDQVTRRRLEGVPAWIIERSLKEEHDSNWKDAYESVDERNVSRGENVIASHVVYKLKVDEKGGKRLKARICPHGNRDTM